jgi:hypothetical protein
MKRETLVSLLPKRWPLLTVGDIDFALNVYPDQSTTKLLDKWQKGEAESMISTSTDFENN